MSNAKPAKPAPTPPPLEGFIKGVSGQPPVQETRPEVLVARRLTAALADAAALRGALRRIALNAAIGLSNPREEVARESLQQIEAEASAAL